MVSGPCRPWSHAYITRVDCAACDGCLAESIDRTECEAIAKDHPPLARRGTDAEGFPLVAAADLLATVEKIHSNIPLDSAACGDEAPPSLLCCPACLVAVQDMAPGEFLLMLLFGLVCSALDAPVVLIQDCCNI